MGTKSRCLIITLVLIISGVAITYYYVPVLKIYPPDILTMSDIFGVLEIYPTKPGGREWFIDMNKPTGDPGFEPGSNITRQSEW